MKLIYSNLGAALGMCALLFVSQRGMGQNRRVDWIHGIGGDASSWQNTADTYNNQRQIDNPTNGSYQTGSGIDDPGGMAGDVQGRTGGPNSIAIGHSMGGVAARQVDINNPNQWSGIITLGSPLRGARIVNAVRDGEAQSFIQNAIRQMLCGPSAGSTAVSIIPLVGILIQPASILGDLFSNNIAGAAVNQIAGSLNLTPATTADLSPDGSYMQGIAGQGTGTPKIQIWGSESDPILWRLAGTFAGRDDEQGADIARTAVRVYNTPADIEFAQSWIVLPLHFYFDWRGNEWAAGRNFINYDSNEGWAYMIGSAYSQTYSGYTPRLICSEEYYYYYCDQASYPEECRNQCWVWEPYSYTLYNRNPSDGVVPDFSQRNDGSAWRDFTLQAPNINHQEHLRYDRIDGTLGSVFDGNQHCRDIFSIARR